MRTNFIITEILEKNNNSKIEDKIKKIRKDADFLELLNSIDYSLLYSSYMHGAYHTEKVLAFAYLIAKEQNLNEVDTRILLDGAIFHDIGRENDDHDPFHGLASRNLLDREKEKGRILQDDIYKDEENLALLKAIIEMHCSEDRSKEIIIEDNEVTDRTRFNRLYKMLKDADALDRTRFHSSSNSFLDPKMLNFECSRNLINFAKELNSIYKIKHEDFIHEKNKSTIEKLKLGPKTCYHGIGYDFLKFRSILKNGILSKHEMQKRGMKGNVNFYGGNSAGWISLVDSEAEKTNSSGYEKFIKDGISFNCSVKETYTSVTKDEQDYALDNGLPYDHSSLNDEVYAYGRIPLENINHIQIPANKAGKKIDDLQYLSMSISSEIFRNKIERFSEMLDFDITVFEDIFLQRERLIDRLSKLKKMTLKTSSYVEEEKLIITELEKQNARAEITIKANVKNFYQRSMPEKEEITLMDAVDYELKHLGYEYNYKIKDSMVIIDNMDRRKQKVV